MSREFLADHVVGTRLASFNCLALLLILGLSIAGCATNQPAPEPGDQAFDEAMRLYKEGDYAGTIKRLQGAPAIWSGSKGLQIRGHKLMAFSYCVAYQRVPCRQEFSEILDIEPDFQLTPAEAGHPIWGPEFKEAKKQHGNQKK